MTLFKHFRSTFPKAFTLIELITVIAIIAILMGLLLPAVTVVRNAANKARAKSDVLNIVNAVKSYYTDYGQYPPMASPGPTASVSGSDVVIGPASQNLSVSTDTNYMLMDVLRNVTDTAGWMTSGTANLRQVVYLDVPNAKGTPPKGGIVSGVSGTATTNKDSNGNIINSGDFVDPWGTAYYVAIDYSYDNVIDGVTIWTDVTTSTASLSQLRTGVISWSLGVDGQLGTKGNKVLNPVGSTPASDDVVSFQ